MNSSILGENFSEKYESKFKFLRQKLEKNGNDGKRGKEKKKRRAFFVTIWFSFSAE